MSETSNLEAARRAKLQWWREQGINPFDNTFRVSTTVAELRRLYDDKTAEELETIDETHSIAGRLIGHRVMGKLAFGRLRTRDGDIQVAFNKATLGDMFALVKKYDVGDIVGVTGDMIRTRTGELTVNARVTQLMTKNLRPLPEKYHGLKDIEIRYRQRYVDLFMNPEVLDIFKMRSRIVSYIRRYLEDRGFIEVETPMMHPLAGGATAKPFVTHHNALDIDLFLRIAPELYLKRLLVGGMEKVFEVNRNFRNEGIDTTHNPEFTMLEFYWAYANYHDLMDLTEHMVSSLVQELRGGTTLTYGDHEVDFAMPWRRLPVRDAVLEYGAARGITEADLTDKESLAACATRLGVKLEGFEGPGRILMELFDAVAEEHIINPTFITDYPLEVSPLSRRRDGDPEMVDRFELMVAGMELANAFSELNDPDDQAQRFRDQLSARAAGDDEAHGMDEDYIRALEYGMPPAAGQGVGIDRLAMLLTGNTSIREVVLFPLLRPEV